MAILCLDAVCEFLLNFCRVRFLPELRYSTLVGDGSIVAAIASQRPDIKIEGIDVLYRVPLIRTRAPIDAIR